MGFLDFFKNILIVGSVLSLLFVGLIISLKSGLVSVGGDRCRVMLANASQLVVSLAALMLGLVMIQQMVGMRFGFW